MEKHHEIKTTEGRNAFIKTLDERETWKFSNWKNEDPEGLAVIREYLPKLYKELSDEYFKGAPRPKYNCINAEIIKNSLKNQYKPKHKWKMYQCLKKQNV